MSEISIKDEQEIDVDIQDYQTPKVSCPMCQATLTFRVKTKVLGIGLVPTKEEAEADGKKITYSKKQHEAMEKRDRYSKLVDAAKKSGLLEAFCKVLDIMPFTPTNKESYFIGWLEKSTKQSAPQFALRECLVNAEIEAKGDLELWGWQNTSVILADKEFKLVLPRPLVNGETVETLELGENGITAMKAMDLDYWVRTKYGYVQRSSVFSSELRKHSIGSFSL